MRRGSKHSPESRAKIAERTRAGMADPEVRRRISERTRAAMADPAVRKRISGRTKAAMADPAVRAKISQRTRAALAGRDFLTPELERLRDAWNAAPPEARRAFMEMVLAPIGEAGR